MMGSDPDIVQPDPEKLPAKELAPPLVTPPATEDKKARQRPKKAPEPRTLPTTEAGEKVADQVRGKLIEMINAAALTEANRRRATAIDSTDFEKGFDLIAGPAKRQHAVAIVADVAQAIGTGLIGYAINVYTGTEPNKIHGHLAMIGGIALLAVGIVIKYVIQWK